MRVRVVQEPIIALAEYASVPIAFIVDRVLDVSDRTQGPGGFNLSERKLEVPYIKDYDAIVGEGAASWARHFDVSKWALFVARADGRRVGGATVAFRTSHLKILEGRDDVAALWDIRIAPDFRAKGIGSALFETVETWAKAQGCRRLKVETQNINVPACRFYARHGCVLMEVHQGAYPGLPQETQLLWYKDIADRAIVSEKAP